MAIESVKLPARFVDTKLDQLLSNWEHLPTFDEFATWDEDDRIDYLVEFHADQSGMSLLVRQRAAGHLTEEQSRRLAALEQLTAERRSHLDRLQAPVEDD